MTICPQPDCGNTGMNLGEVDRVSLDADIDVLRRHEHPILFSEGVIALDLITRAFSCSEHGVFRVVTFYERPHKPAPEESS